MTLTAREAMLAMPLVESPMPVDLIEEAIGLYRMGRRQGVTVRSFVDCRIAACTIRDDREVLHRNRDYDQLARVSGLRARHL